jgi:hypothetical protein
MVRKYLDTEGRRKHMDTLRERDEGSLFMGYPVDERAAYCPECGRAWPAAPDLNAGKAAPAGWWPWLLVVVGIFLLVAYGPRAWSSVAVPGIKPALRPVGSCWMAGSGQYYADCDPTNARVGAALGLAWSVVGLGAIARRAVPWERRRGLSGNEEAVDLRIGTPDLIAGLARGIWALGEATCRSLFALLVILVGDVGLSRLIEGVPPSGPLATQAIERALGVVALALGSLP